MDIVIAGLLIVIVYLLSVIDSKLKKRLDNDERMIERMDLLINNNLKNDETK